MPIYKHKRNKWWEGENNKYFFGDPFLWDYMLKIQYMLYIHWNMGFEKEEKDSRWDEKEDRKGKVQRIWKEDYVKINTTNTKKI